MPAMPALNIGSVLCETRGGRTLNLKSFDFKIQIPLYPEIFHQSKYTTAITNAKRTFASFHFLQSFTHIFLMEHSPASPVYFFQAVKGMAAMLISAFHIAPVRFCTGGRALWFILWIYVRKFTEFYRHRTVFVILLFTTMSTKRLLKMFSV